MLTFENRGDNINKLTAQNAKKRQKNTLTKTKKLLTKVCGCDNL